MLPQRARGAESRAEHRLEDGPLRVRGKAMPSMAQRVGIR